MRSLLVASTLLCVLGMSSPVVGVKSSTSPSTTVLTCSFPDSFIALSMYQLDPATNETTKLSPESDDGTMSFNGQYSEKFGLTYSTDSSGAINIVSSKKIGVSVPSGSSLSDHGRWCPCREHLLFSSTREPNPISNQGWNAVYIASYHDSTNSMGEATRLTPPNVTDYSPAWGPHVSGTKGTGYETLVAVASGSGAAGGTDIVLMVVTEDTWQVNKRWTLAKNGGWPTFLDSKTVLFHRNTGTMMDTWSIMAVDIETGYEWVYIADGMTPTVSDSDANTEKIVAYSYVEYSTGFRQVALYNNATGQTSRLTEGTNAHHYNPYHDPSTGMVYFNKCRGGTMPNIHRRLSPDPTLDIGTVSGDFPSISPDGQSVSVIYANYNSFLSVDIFDINGENRKTVYNATHAWMTSWVNQSHLAFTAGPAFSSATDASVQVAKLDVATGETTQLSHSDSANQGYPCYSPDGTQIVYRSSYALKNENGDFTGLPGPYHLRTMPSTGADAPGLESSRTLTPPLTADDYAGVGDTHPHWGPNFIVFSSDRGHPGHMGIWTVNFDGSNLTEIFYHGAQNVHPAVTVDGRIVFTSTIAEYSMEEIAWPYTFFPRAELFVMDPDGTNPKRLTHDASNQANAWAGPQPLPTTLSTSGSNAECQFLDSTNPAPAAPAPPPTEEAECGGEGSKKKPLTRAEKQQKKKKSACPFASLFFNADKVLDKIAPADHAVFRKHGTKGTQISPKERHARDEL